MKRTRIALLASALLLGCVITLGAAAQPKFRPYGSDEAGVGRYVVTLTEDAGVEDPAALRRELALLYGARLEADTSSGVRQFALTMTPARARLLSADPRVIEVAEVPLSTTAAAPPGISSVAPAPTDRRFVTQSSGYGDNGQSGTYTYDGAGNITAIGADTYLYDTAQRLVHSVTRGVQEDYSYDAFGNRMSATGAINCLGQTTCAQSVTVDSNTNHLTTINNVNVTYDAAGNISNVSGSPGAVYSYDGTGMMTEATVGSDDRQFIYTADGERIAVRQGASWTWTVRDLNGKVLREFTSLETGPNLAMTNRQWVKDYVWRDGLLLATVTPSGTLHYHLDHLGTPRLVTDGNGVKVAEHAYYPFGAEINLAPHETPEEAMKFTGHERDIVAGDGHTLDYMHARYYNASLGRFLSVDPIEGDPGNPQSWNRYAYVQNNPINRTDPRGLCGEGGGFVGPIVPCEATLSPPKNASSWTAAQRSAENAKNAERAQLAEQGKLVVNRGQARPSSSQVADVNGGPASSGSHLDHKQELVLGGAPLAKENIGTLDATVNMSNGARVKNAIAGLADGTVITKFNYTLLSWGGALTTITQGISYSNFMSNQDAAHPGSVNVNDMARWVFTGNTSASPPPCGSPGGGPC